MDTRLQARKQGWLACVGLLVFCLPVLAGANTKELMLMGGAIIPCPEMMHAQCYQDDIPDQRRIVLDDATLSRVANSDIWSPERENSKVLSKILLRHVADRQADKALSPDELWQELTRTYISRSGKDLSSLVERNGLRPYTDLSGKDPIVLRGDQFVTTLAAHERALMLDLLTIRSPAYDPVNPALLQDFAALANAFHEEHHSVAAENGAHVLIISAARDQSMNSIKHLMATMKKLGLRPEWLPLDAAVAVAIEGKQCQNLAQLRARHLGRIDLNRFHPELSRQQAAACQQPEQLTQVVAQADAVLLLDGSLALLQSSLFDSQGQAYEWTQELHQRFQRGDLFIGAAGAAAQMTVGRENSQSTPLMHADEADFGTSLQRQWCQSYNCGMGYYKSQGLALFQLGSIDTYTAEKGREYRLLRAAASGSGIGIGIDDGTALHLRWRSADDFQMRVLGSGTILLVDTRDAQYDDKHEMEWTLRQAKLSRLVPGTIVRVANEEYSLAMPSTHAAKPRQLIPPNRLIDPFFFRSWTQWFVANELPYAEAEYHVRPVQALLRLQRPAEGFRFYIADNGLVGFRDLIADLSFDRH